MSKIFLVKSDIEKKGKIKVFEAIKVPFAHIFIESKVKLPFFVFSERNEHHGNFGESKFFRNGPTKVSTDDDVFTLGMFVDDERINKAEAFNAL